MQARYYSCSYTLGKRLRRAEETQTKAKTERDWSARHGSLHYFSSHDVTERDESDWLDRCTMQWISRETPWISPRAEISIRVESRKRL
jgi:hypothetical protein